MTSTPTGSVIRLAAAAGIVAILLTACTTSGGGASSGPSAAPSAAAGASPAASASSGGGKGGGDYSDEYAPRSAAPAASADPAAGAVTVGLASGPDGDYLTGVDDLTLYVFGNDSANTSTCDGDCAATWPPFTIAPGTELLAVSDVTGALTTISRADGSMQVVYAGSPLYYYVADTAPGDTKGQGIGDVWFIAKP